MMNTGVFVGVVAAATISETVAPHDFVILTKHPIYAVLALTVLACLSAFVREIEARKKAGVAPMSLEDAAYSLARKFIVGVFAAMIALYIAIDRQWSTSLSIIVVGGSAFFGLEFIEALAMMARNWVAKRFGISSGDDK